MNATKPILPYTALACNDLAAEFARQLRLRLSPLQIEEMARENAGETPDGICHSHDYCDANEVMAAAFVKLFTVELDPSDEHHLKITNDAWTRAKLYHVSEIGLALHDLGMRLQHQGGGLFNWRLNVMPGLELFCCAEDGTEPEDKLPVTFGIMLEASESIGDRMWTTGAQLAKVLRENVNP